MLSQSLSRSMSELPGQSGPALPLPYGRVVPCVDGSLLARVFFNRAAGRLRPCVRPVCAVHVTAGHKALR
jgi:hypothetical protein